MAYEWIGAAAAAAASGASALAMSAKKRGSTRMMQVSKELANYNNELSLKNWRLQNEYDSPVAQMERFKEAGLNPNLIYGQMSSGQAPSAGQVSTDPNDYTAGSDRYAQALQGVAGAIGMYQDLKAKQGQIDQARAVTEQVQTQKLLNLQTAEKQQLENEYSRAAMSYKLEGLAYDNARKLRQNSVGDIYDMQHAINKLEGERKKIQDMNLDSDVKRARIRQIDSSIEASKENLALAKERNRISERGLAVQFGQLEYQNRDLEHRMHTDMLDYDLRKSADTRANQDQILKRNKAIMDTYQKLDDPGNGLFGIPKFVHNIFNTARRRSKNINAVEHWYNR